MRNPFFLWIGISIVMFSVLCVTYLIWITVDAVDDRPEPVRIQSTALGDSGAYVGGTATDTWGGGDSYSISESNVLPAYSESSSSGFAGMFVSPELSSVLSPETALDSGTDSGLASLLKNKNSLYDAASYLIQRLKSDRRIPISCPRGWKVTELRNGLRLLEKLDLDSAGMILLVENLANRVASGDDMAKAGLQMLKTKFHKLSVSDLNLLKQKIYQRASNVLNTEAKFNVNDLPFKSDMLSFVDKRLDLGISALFYAPLQRYGSFDPEILMLQSISPIFNEDPQRLTERTPVEQRFCEPARFPVPQAQNAEIKKSICYVSLFENSYSIKEINPWNGKTNPGYNFKQIKIGQLAMARGKIVLPLLGNATPVLSAGTGRDLDEDFMIKLPVDDSFEALHPSISSDGMAVVVNLRRKNDDTEYANDNNNLIVASFEVKTGAVETIFLRTGSKGEICPAVFSPVENIVVYEQDNKLVFCDGSNGENKIRSLFLPENFRRHYRSGIAYSADGSLIAYIAEKIPAENSGEYSIVCVDANTGMSADYDIPNSIRPYSPSGVVSIDFSPDGRYLVFSATGENLAEWWGRKTLDSKMIYESNLYVLNLSNAKCFQITSGGRNFDPVWKGR